MDDAMAAIGAAILALVVTALAVAIVEQVLMDEECDELRVIVPAPDTDNTGALEFQLDGTITAEGTSKGDTSGPP
jgi:hypothetical protein